MFLGTIHENVRLFVASLAAENRGKKIIAGCSDNLTVERLFSRFGVPAEIHSNDVTLHTYLLTSAVRQTPVKLELMDSDFAFVAPFLGASDPWIACSAVMIVFRMLQYENQGNAHNRRMWRHHIANFEGLVYQSAAKMSYGLPPEITSYHNGDVFDHFKRFADDKDAIFTASFPFFTGGYEKMFKRMDEIFSWPKPEYPMLDDKRREEIIKWMRERKHFFLLYEPLSRIKPSLVANKHRDVWVYCYTNLTKDKAVFRRKRSEEDPKYPILPADYEFTRQTQISLTKVPSANSAFYKGQYLAKNIDYSNAMWAFAVMADDYVIGFLEYSLTSRAFGARDSIYMMGDFVVGQNKTAKLSKLVVMLSCCADIRKEIRRLTVQDIKKVLTTAFTDRAVSMKYRGVYRLVKRGENNGKKFLNYEALLGGRRSKQTYQQWFRKTQRQKPSSNS